VGSLVRAARRETLGVTKRDLSEGEQKRHLEWLGAAGRQADLHAAAVLRWAVSGGDAVCRSTRLSDTFGRYFTSTIGYMLALAIGRLRLDRLYGIDLASDVEYPQQRPNAEYLIGLARGMGKTVVIAPASALCKAGHLYGYEKPLDGVAAGAEEETRGDVEHARRRDRSTKAAEFQARRDVTAI
jgi:hypothetical protein